MLPGSHLELATTAASKISEHSGLQVGYSWAFQKAFAIGFPAPLEWIFSAHTGGSWHPWWREAWATGGKWC